MNRPTQYCLGALTAALAVPTRCAAPAWRAARRLAYVTQLRAAGATVPVTTQFDGRVHTPGRVRLSLGEHCRLGRDVYLETSGAGRIRIGSHVRINTGSMIAAQSEVSIGNDCLIGEYVSIRDANHGMVTDQPMRLQPCESAPVTIGEGAWVGRGAAILKGVTVGANAVVAANSVVTKDVPPMAVVGGVPARVLKWRDGRNP